MTSDTDRQRLLQMARAAIEAYIRGDALSEAHQPSASDPLGRRAGAFVTIQHEGELRGCIGRIEADKALSRVVCECAIAACSADPRFPPVSAAEFPSLDIEISLLGPFEMVASAGEVEVGRHGLLVEKDGLRGLLLPQVATEWNWDRETFLAQTCRKAGLPRDAWKKGAAIWRFEAEVFGEGQKGR